MKKIIQLLSIIIIAGITGISCSDNSSGGGLTNPFGGGTGTTGGVTFSISSMQGQQGGTVFTTTPTVSVKITKVTISLPAQQFTDVIQGDGTTVFNANQAVEINEYIGVAAGQLWTFQFEGTIASDNQAFNVTSNYTVK